MPNISHQHSSEGVPQQNVLDLRARMRAAATPPAKPGKKPLRKAVQAHLIALRPATFTIQKPQIRGVFARPGFRRLATLPAHWRSVIVFASIALLLLSPFFLSGPVRQMHAVRGEVLAASTQAYAFLQSAGDQASQFHFTEAEQSFTDALAAFENAQKSFDSVNGALLGVLRVLPFTSASVVTGESLLDAGQAVSRAGKRFAQAAQTLNATTDTLDPSLQTDNNLAGVFTVLAPAFDEIDADIQKALDAIAKVDAEQVPEKYRDAFTEVQNQLPALYVAFHRMQSSVEVLTGVFSGEEKQYAVVFQNSNELRPSGGFMGSWALLRVRDGAVKVLEVPGRGFLDLNFGTDAPYAPPEPLQLINPAWQVQDANWWPDFPTTAQKINWFYERARGYELDGVIAITPNLVEELLQLTGSIALPEFETTVQPHDFRTTLQDAVELEYDRELNQPKQIIGALLPKLLEQVFRLPTSELLKAATVLTNGFVYRDIQMYSNNPEVQEQIVALGWGGEVLQAPRDYLLVAEANIGGGKTDGVLQQEVTHEISVQADGSLEAHVTLQRRHTGDPDDRWTGIKNVSYIRFYVPQHSQLLSAQGFSSIGPERFQSVPPDAQIDGDLEESEQRIGHDEVSNTDIYEGFGKTVFGNWVEVGPGEEVTVTLQYRLPFHWDTVQQEGYSLYVQQQPGAMPRQLKSSFAFPQGYVPKWLTPAHGEIYRLGETVQFEAELGMDQSYAVLFEQR